ncbi:uncharacterized protein LOC102807049 isoform X1 [Saccoglossus kowalevskii]
MLGESADGECHGIRDAYVTIDKASTDDENERQRLLSATNIAQLTEIMETVQRMIIDLKNDVTEMKRHFTGKTLDSLREEGIVTKREVTKHTDTRNEDKSGNVKAKNKLQKPPILRDQYDAERNIQEDTDHDTPPKNSADRKIPSYNPSMSQTCNFEFVKSPNVVQDYFHNKISRHTVAHFKFDQDSSDTSGSNNHGNAMDGVKFESRSGIKDGAARFAGDGKINVDGFRLYPWGSGFSVSLWVKRTADWAKEVTILSNGAPEYGTWDIRMGHQMAGQMIGASIFTCWDAYRRQWTYQDILAEHNTWHHVALSFDGSKLDFYLDGQKRPKTIRGPCNSDTPTRDTPLTIGGGGVGTIGSYFTGLIDELLILNTSLTYEEVHYLYTLHDPRECESPYIVAHFTFDDDFNDQSCHQRHASYDRGASVEPSNAVIDSAMMFNGVNTIKVALLKNYPYGNQFSVSLRYKRTGNFKKEQSIVWHHSWEIRAGASSRIGGAVRTKDRNTESGSLVIGQSSSYPYENIQAADDEWHHVVMTYDGSLLMFYLDGERQPGDVSCCIGDIVIPEAPLVIGGRNIEQGVVRGGQDKFHGLISELSLYRKVLRQEDVIRLLESLDS